MVNGEYVLLNRKSYQNKLHNACCIYKIKEIGFKAQKQLGQRACMDKEVILMFLNREWWFVLFFYLCLEIKGLALKRQNYNIFWYFLQFLSLASKFWILFHFHKVLCTLFQPNKNLSIVNSKSKLIVFEFQLTARL